MFDPNLPQSLSPIPPAPPAGGSQHQGLSIASFVLGLLSFVGLCLMFAIIFYAASSLGITSSSNLDVSALSSSPLVSVFGIVLLGSILISLIGLVLGIVSLFQKARARVLGILGVVLNLVFLLGICLLFVLSISMSSTL